MNAIDPQTGLPALPDGMFWRIVPAERDGFSEIQIVIAGENEWSEWEEGYAPWSNWRSETLAYEVRINKERVRGRLFARRRVFHEMRMRRLTHSVYAETFRVTSENLVSCCERALRNFLQNAKAASLYGDYPPKRHVVPEIESETSS